MLPEKYRRFLLLFLLIFFAGFDMNLGKLFRPEPVYSSNTAKLLFRNSGGLNTLNPGQNLDLELWLDPTDNQVRGFELQFISDPDIIGFQGDPGNPASIIEFEPGSGFDINQSASMPRSIDAATGRIRMNMVTTNSTTYVQGGERKVATFKLRINPTATTGNNVMFQALPQGISGSTISDKDLNNVLENPTTPYALSVGNGDPNSTACHETIFLGNVYRAGGCIEYTFTRVLGAVVGLAILAVFGVLSFGGYQFLTSRGDAVLVAKARQTMTYAVIGIAFLTVSYLILRLVQAFTGVNVLQFHIPFFPNPS